MPLTHLAMAFAITNPGVTCAIIGPRTMEHLDDLLAGAETTLADEILDRIDAIDASRHRRRGHWTWPTTCLAIQQPARGAAACPAIVPPPEVCGLADSLLASGCRSAWPGPLAALLLFYRPIFDRLLAVCEGDERIRAFWLSGSLAKGTADSGSGPRLPARHPGDADFDESASFYWREWLATITPTLLARELPLARGSFYSTTTGCERLGRREQGRSARCPRPGTGAAAWSSTVTAYSGCRGPRPRAAARTEPGPAPLDGRGVLPGRGRSSRSC